MGIARSARKQTALDFPERMRIARRGAKLSRRELAAKVGVTTSACALWENPRGTMPSVEHLASTARALHVSFEWLATGRGAVRDSAMEESHAAELKYFAHDLEEEQLLGSWRRAPRKQRSLLLTLLESLGS